MHHIMLFPEQIAFVQFEELDKGSLTAILPKKKNRTGNTDIPSCLPVCEIHASFII